ncbi:sulfite reductase subunit alpha [Sphingomonas naphthae]|uniref:NADPH--hemoprotein reductase n=1 Tax=Sphingomonas naphthae TaxID=1813468 RepID=A0ABY7TFU5_9SPHN|nr:sulfite reductase subunit alpha [Sphingomonas naphthae]WCT71841.1 sulfite reductase subunit alpha [Sphingomonas naphthae]
MTSDPLRLAGAAAALLLWLALCLAIAWVRRRAARAEKGEAGALLIAHASQTGFAAGIAQRTAEALRDAGVPVRLAPLGKVDAAMLGESRQALFVVSTTGEGDAPDEASRFVRGAMAAPGGLAHLDYALLALGDRSYDHYCGFGHALDHWLRESGARPATDLIEVDNGDPAGLRQWQERLRLFGADADAADWLPPRYGAWRLAARTHLNPGSPGGEVHLIRLDPPAGEAPLWSAGAIAEIYPGPFAHAAEGDHAHRAYSIASLPADGAVELVVRLMHDPEGRPGLGSGWLCRTALAGEPIALRLRDNPAFAAPDPDRPMILIGNGTGIAGLRAHLKARPFGSENWLIFGERHAATDSLFADELIHWTRSGHLARLDRAFSRDDPARPYVQHLIAHRADAVRDWVANGAAIYVCGSLEGMAAGVDAALTDILGREALETLTDETRYRRDVY